MIMTSATLWTMSLREQTHREFCQLEEWRQWRYTVEMDAVKVHWNCIPILVVLDFDFHWHIQWFNNHKLGKILLVMLWVSWLAIFDKCPGASTLNLNTVNVLRTYGSLVKMYPTTSFGIPRLPPTKNETMTAARKHVLVRLSNSNK